MSDNKDNKTETDATVSATEPASRNGRRRFLAGGMAAAPVFLTLASRPALAGNRICTPSAWVSANPANASFTGPDTCYGRSPGYWKGPGNDLATSHCSQNAGNPSPIFSSLFGGVWEGDDGAWGTGASTVSANITICEVLYLAGSEDTHKFAFHLVAAWLNASYEPDGDFPMTPQQVVDIGTAIVTTGQYQVSPGVIWNAQDAKDFFFGTQD